jgi:DNA-binding NarL/FixJ family response regulator
MSALTRWQRPPGTDKPAFAELTPRQADVLTCLCDGITSDKAIAKHLFVEVSTIKHHIKAILLAFDATDRAHAVALAWSGRVIPFVKGTRYAKENAA